MSGMLMVGASLVRCPNDNGFRGHRVVYDWGSLTYRWYCLDCDCMFYTHQEAGEK